MNTAKQFSIPFCHALEHTFAVVDTLCRYYGESAIYTDLPKEQKHCLAKMHANVFGNMLVSHGKIVELTRIFEYLDIHGVTYDALRLSTIPRYKQDFAVIRIGLNVHDAYLSGAKALLGRFTKDWMGHKHVDDETRLLIGDMLLSASAGLDFMLSYYNDATSDSLEELLAGIEKIISSPQEH